MSRRSERLQRLVIGSECQVSWDSMQGEGPRRFCAQCEREVFDFARLTPAEIAARLQATRGKICARLTRGADGRLVMASGPEPEVAAPSWVNRRLAAAAATLVGAWLATSRADAAPGANAESSAVAPAEPARAELAAARARTAAPPRSELTGRVVDDQGASLPGVTLTLRSALDGSTTEKVTNAQGEFAFPDLADGLYDVTAQLEGFSSMDYPNLTVSQGKSVSMEIPMTAAVEGTAMGGAIAAAPDPLRVAFEQSTLVVDATVGRSQVGEGDDTAEVVTDLQVDAVLKGEVERRRLKYQHYESREVGEDGVELWRADFAPGTRVLAFLDPSEDGLGRSGRIYEQSSFGWGVRHFDDSDQHDSYVERIEALAKLERRNGREVVPDAEDLVEWLVSTTEEPATRGEEAGELLQAVLALHDHAESSGVSDAAAALELRSIVDRFRDEGGEVTESPRYEVLGAFLTDEQRARLTTALDSSRGFAETDRTLFSLVLRWDPAAARRWLAGALAADAAANGGNEIWWLSSVAEELDDDALAEVAAEASARAEEIGAQWPDDQTDQTEALREEQILAVSKELRGKFAELLVP